MRDVRGLVEHGLGAPRYAERIWFDPSACAFATLQFARRHSGETRAGDWDTEIEPVDNLAKIEFCRLHWEDGVPWEETGAFDHWAALSADGRVVDNCSSLDDLAERYRRLDRMFEQLRTDRRLRTRRELPGRSFRELGGIYIHVDRSGKPLFGGGGFHRFAAAQILGFTRAPAQVGVVHSAALPGWRSALQG